MYKIFTPQLLLVAFIFGFSQISTAQINPEEQVRLKGLEELKTALIDADFEKTTFKQNLSYEEISPWKVTLSVEAVNKKNGKSNIDAYTFNLNDLDPLQIKSSIKKEEVLVELKIKENDKFIQHVKNGKLQNYVSRFNVYMNSTVDAQELEAAIKETISPAKELWAPSVKIPSTSKEQKEWLLDNVSAVEWGNDGIGQGLTTDAEAADRLVLELEKAKGKKNLDQESFAFSLADLEEGNIKLNVKNKRLFVKAGTTKNNKYIEHTTQNGKAYVDALEIHVANVDQGRMLVDALKNLAPYGRKELESRLPKPAGVEDGIKMLSETISSFATKKENIEQSLSTEFIARYIIEESAVEKPESVVKSSLFHFYDLNANAITIKDATKEIAVDAGTKSKLKYIQNTVEGLAANYSSSITFKAKSVENARLIQHLLRYIINEMENIAPDARSGRWLAETAEAAVIENVTQKLELQDTSCAIKFVSTLETPKKTTESIYEFTALDLDPSGLSIVVNGKNVGVKCGTQRKTKIKTYNKDGEEKTVENVSIYFNSIEEVRIAIASLKEMIANCGN